VRALSGDIAPDIERGAQHLTEIGALVGDRRQEYP
jgi:hypothetical protein